MAWPPHAGKDTRFKPGESGNPDGKPVGAKSLTTLVREALEDLATSKETGEQIVLKKLLVKRILKKAIDQGDTRMIQILWEHLDGKAAQKIDVTHELGEQSRESVKELTDFFRSVSKPVPPLLP